MKNKNQTGLMDKLVSLCKRRGFIFQASDIYGGFNGFFDYGPLGVELRNNIKQVWWKDMVQKRTDIVGLDSSIIQHPKVWQASGHIDGFSDPMVDCKESKMRYRADQLFFAEVIVESDTIGYVSAIESESLDNELLKQAEKLKKKLAKQGKLEKLSIKSYTDAKPEEYELVPSPATGKPGSLTAPREFNLMFQTNVGAMTDASSVAYLRPETAQGIFINFKNLVDSGRVKVPFGIAQIGKAFRNEITPRNFIFRSREFEQMEIEYFIQPDDDIWQNIHKEWIQTRLNWFYNIGISKEKLTLEEHPNEKLAHYAKACTDITFKFPFGVQELEGIAARGNFDLTQHQNSSGKSMEYFDETRKERYIPHVIEPSLGVDRTLLALLTDAYLEDEIDGEKRIVLRLNPRIAPVKAGIFPLVKNKPEIMEKAQKLHKLLSHRWNVSFDTSGAIGRRYRRMDEIGTPYCITVDFDSLEDNTVTIRDRDSAKQIRLNENEIVSFFDEKFI